MVRYWKWTLIAPERFPELFASLLPLTLVQRSLLSRSDWRLWRAMNHYVSLLLPRDVCVMSENQ